MSAEVLRRAAVLMRERAEGVNYPSPWQVGGGTCDIRCNDGRVYVASTYGGVGTEQAAATHIASWHPTVALAVADQLDGIAAVIEEAADGPLAIVAAGLAEKSLTVARAYLGDADV